MTARDTYNSSVESAGATLVASSQANATAVQETISVSGVNVDYTLQSGNNANFVAATKNANALKASNELARRMALQASIAAARDALRTSGDLAPF